eukprot:s2872_g5.t1
MAGPQCWEPGAAGVIETTRGHRYDGPAPRRCTELLEASAKDLPPAAYLHLQPCQSLARALPEPCQFIFFHSPGASADIPSNAQSAVPPASFPAWYFAACLVHTAGWPGNATAVSPGPAPRPPFCWGWWWARTWWERKFGPLGLQVVQSSWDGFINQGKPKRNWILP